MRESNLNLTFLEAREHSTSAQMVGKGFWVHEFGESLVSYCLQALAFPEVKAGTHCGGGSLQSCGQTAAR